VCQGIIPVVKKHLAREIAKRRNGSNDASSNSSLSSGLQGN
jgi:hypothetical protein